MKIVLDVIGEPKENDIIIFKDGAWKVIAKDSFLAGVINKQAMKNVQYEGRIERLEKTIVELAKIIKEK